MILSNDLEVKVEKTKKPLRPSHPRVRGALFEGKTIAVQILPIRKEKSCDFP